MWARPPKCHGGISFGDLSYLVDSPLSRRRVVVQFHGQAVAVLASKECPRRAWKKCGSKLSALDFTMTVCVISSINCTATFNCFTIFNWAQGFISTRFGASTLSAWCDGLRFFPHFELGNPAILPNILRMTESLIFLLYPANEWGDWIEGTQWGLIYNHSMPKLHTSIVQIILKTRIVDQINSACHS